MNNDIYLLPDLPYSLLMWSTKKKSEVAHSKNTKQIETNCNIIEIKSDIHICFEFTHLS